MAGHEFMQAGASALRQRNRCEREFGTREVVTESRLGPPTASQPIRQRIRRGHPRLAKLEVVDELPRSNTHPVQLRDQNLPERWSAPSSAAICAARNPSQRRRKRSCPHHHRPRLHNRHRPRTPPHSPTPKPAATMSFAVHPAQPAVHQPGRARSHVDKEQAKPVHDALGHHRHRVATMPGESIGSSARWWDHPRLRRIDTR